MVTNLAVVPVYKSSGAFSYMHALVTEWLRGQSKGITLLKMSVFLGHRRSTGVVSFFSDSKHYMLRQVTTEVQLPLCKQYAQVCILFELPDGENQRPAGPALVINTCWWDC